MIYEIKADSTLNRLASAIYSYRNSLMVLFTVLFIIAFTMFATAKPIYEWDLFAYLGNGMLIAQEQSFAELHQNVYQVVKSSVPAKNYAWLIESSSRLTISQDSEAYRQTITFFYDSRIFYKYIIAGLVKTGMNPVTAIYGFSTFCVVLTLLLLLRLLPSKTPVGLYFVMPFIVLALGLFTVARLASPDAFAALVTVGLYFLLLRERVYFLLCLFPIVIFVRTDLILLVALFHAYFLFCNRAPKLWVIVSGLLTIGAYLTINHVLVEGDPWSSLIGYNFGDKPTHPEQYVFPISISDYLGYLWIGVLSLTYNPITFVFFLFTAIALVILSTRLFSQSANFRLSQIHADLLFLVFSSTAYFVIHFLLFPVSWIRFFAAQYSLVAVVLCWCAFALLSSYHRTAQTGLSFLKND